MQNKVLFQKKRLLRPSRGLLSVLCLILCLVLFCSCDLLLESGSPSDPLPSSAEETSSDPDTSVESSEPSAEPTYSYRIDISPYLEAITTENDFLINKTHPCGSAFVPAQLRTISDRFSQRTIQMEETAALALEAMLLEMEADGIRHVFVTSGYRSYEYQSQLFIQYFQKEKEANSQLSDDEIREIVRSYSAYPGESEHQSGLCADLMTTQMSELVNYGSETPNHATDLGFAETSAFTWLSQNAYRFGFILRYPEEKEDITGYSYESWHYRFVGRRLATYLYQNDLTLEEYGNLSS